jgi:hypothetical protein
MIVCERERRNTNIKLRHEKESIVIEKPMPFQPLPPLILINASMPPPRFPPTHE